MGVSSINLRFNRIDVADIDSSKCGLSYLLPFDEVTVKTACTIQDPTLLTGRAHL